MMRRRHARPILPPILLLSLLVFLLLPAAAYEKHLFKQDPDTLVEELDGARFQEAKENAAAAPYAIMFYSPTCGHCIHFAPIWKRVAEEMAGTEIAIGAVSCIAEQAVCQEQKVHGYPTLKAFGLEGQEAGVGVVIGAHEQAAIVKWLKNHYKRHFSPKTNNSSGNSTSNAQQHPQPQSLISAQPDVDQDAMDTATLRQGRVEDAFTSLHFAFDHDVFLGEKELTGEGLESLKDLLRVLSVLFPGQARRQAFRDILDTLEPQQKLSIAEWEDNLEQNFNPVLPPSQRDKKDYQWVLCKPDAGYTGGLWFLFHILTVKSAISSGSGSDPSAVSPAAVLEVIHNFVRYFFGCAECKEHFLKAYESVRPKYEDQGGKGAVLWIYDLHDQVNVRLNKTRWPASCQKCWKTEGNGTIEPETNEIYKLLIEAYGIHDTHLEWTGSSAYELSSLSHDYFFIGIIIVIVCGAAIWRIEQRITTGRRKRRERLPI